MSAYVRCHPVRDVEARRAYMRQQQRCLACSRPGMHRGWLGVILAPHHVIRFGRSDEACNLMALCWLGCHMAAHDGVDDRPPLSLANALWLKRERDKESWNPERLAQLYGQALPELEPPPAWYLEQWERR